ncbi:transposase [Streptomyces hirsutus]|uniref:transposase n=1 Tax=Streptomyces hirsutus TaxID=35620 RepID=UPI00099F15C3|nr:transposase [Streptomyces hirsutus]
MGSKYTKRCTEEFRRDAIALVDSSGRTVAAVAREFGISSESPRGWYPRAKADRGEGEAARRARQAADDALAHEITLPHLASRKTYGVPSAHAEHAPTGPAGEP